MKVTKVTIHSDGHDDYFWVMKGHNSLGSEDYVFTEMPTHRFRYYLGIKKEHDDMVHDLSAAYGVIKNKEWNNES